MVSYNLKNIDFNNFCINKFTSDNNELLIKNKNISLNNDIYLIKYDKSKLNDINNNLYRSLIMSNSKILSFSPPKSVNFNTFTSENDCNECFAEDFIDGTMINLFYYNDMWQIATKSCIDGKVSYFVNDYKNIQDNTFNTMFYECCNNANLNVELLEKTFSYSFVFQHPKNRIVTPIVKTLLYCVRIYSFENNNIHEVPFDYFYKNYDCFKNTEVYLPNRYPITSYDELLNYYGSQNTQYYCVGIMLYNKNGVRTKIRNPNYEIIRKLRGNHPKLQYQYLCLRKENKVREFLNYYPEYKKSFSEYKTKMHEFTNSLYTNYKECFIFKLKSLKLYDFQYKIHMFNIHKIYLEKLRPNNENISKQIIIDYVNELHPAQQMFSINYELRK